MIVELDNDWQTGGPINTVMLAEQPEALFNQSSKCGGGVKMERLSTGLQ